LPSGAVGKHQLRKVGRFCLQILTAKGISLFQVPFTPDPFLTQRVSVLNRTQVRIDHVA
jgi:hypothetical protein